MPELHFKGKEYVYNHHLNVPFRPLLAQPDKSLGEDSGNLIIHGDNLHALKALLPRYAGKVDCIFIDPPYNTGNENWCYNDAETISQAHADKKHLVFAAAQYAPNRLLLPLGVEHAPLPFALYRMEKE